MWCQDHHTFIHSTVMTITHCFCWLNQIGFKSYPEWLHLGQWPLHSFPKLPPLRANMKHQAWCLSLHVMPRSHYHSPTKQYKRLENIAAVAHRFFYNLKSISICGSVPQNVLLRFSVRANMKRQAYCQSLYVVLSLPQYHSLSRQKGIYWKWQ